MWNITQADVRAVREDEVTPNGGSDLVPVSQELNPTGRKSA